MFLQRLQMTADDLIDRSFPYTRGFTFVGAKEREIVGLNMKSGQVCLLDIYVILQLMKTIFHCL